MSGSAVDTKPPPKVRKTRPLKGFTTSQYTNLNKSGVKDQGNQPVVMLSLPTASDTSDDPLVPPKKKPAAARSGHKLTRTYDKNTSGLVKLPVRLAKNTRAGRPTTIVPQAPRKQAPAANNKTKESARNSTEPPLNVPKEFIAPNNGKLHSSQIPHFGPIFPTRDAILARGSRPYVHAACGKRFKSPQDVKNHHRKYCNGKTGNIEGWDDHVSCKIDHTQISYIKATDGYVILDQESYDKVRNAIAIGLRDVEEPMVVD